MNKYYLYGFIVIVSVIGLGFLFGGSGTVSKAEDVSEPLSIPLTQKIETTLPSGAEKIEVFSFHATNRCISCINISKYSKAVIEEKFSEELNSGKITFREVNIDLPENFKMAKDYGVSGSALYINVIKEGKDNHEEDTTVWRLVTNEAQMKSYLEAKLKSLL